MKNSLRRRKLTDVRSPTMGMSGMYEWLTRLPKPFVTAVCLALAVVTGIVDYTTGLEVSVMFLYLIPVGLSSWFAGRGSGIFTAFVCSGIWLAADVLVREMSGVQFVSYWNAFMLLSSLLVVAFLTSALRQINERLEATVKQRTAELRKTIGELEHFSYSLTHDMRAPLRAMRSFASLMLADCKGDCSRDGKDYLRNISMSADRMDQLIVDALDYSKAIREKMPLTTVDADVLLRGMLQSYPAFQSSLATIQIEGSIPPVVGNRAGLTQCFSNLLNNAVKFVPPGRMPQVRIWAEQDSGCVRVWFEDNGIGIHKDDHERIFEMFQRLNMDYPGTGIGLALVRKVIERMNGRVGVESEPGRGSRFWLDLEAASVARQEAA